MVNIKQLLVKLLQALVVHTSGNWRYLKIGPFFIGSYSGSTTGAITTATGSIYVSPGVYTLTYPETLSTPTYAHVTAYNPAKGIWAILYTTSNTDLTYRLMSSVSQTSTTWYIKSLVIGIM